MAPETKTSRGERTKKKIADAFLMLIRKKRWDTIRVTDICAAADITRGTFYQYFDDIYDLMGQIQDNICEQMRQMYTKNSPAKQSRPSASGDIMQHISDEVPRLFEVWFTFCREHKDAMIALTNEEYGDPYFIKKIKNIVIPHLDSMMDHDGLPRDALRHHFQQLFFAMHYHSMIIWLSSDNDIPPNKMAQVLNSIRIGAAYDWFTKDRLSGASEKEQK